MILVLLLALIALALALILPGAWSLFALPIAFAAMGIWTKLPRRHDTR